MMLPEKFPAGCLFFDDEGDVRVAIPGLGLFGLSRDGANLKGPADDAGRARFAASFANHHGDMLSEEEFCRRAAERAANKEDVA